MVHLTHDAISSIFLVGSNEGAYKGRVQVIVPFVLLPPLMFRGNTFPLIFGKLLMLANQLPCKMMEGMRLRFVHCAATSTSPHFVVNAMKIIVLSVLTLTVGTKFFVSHKTQDLHLTCVEWNSQIRFYDVCSVLSCVL